MTFVFLNDRFVPEHEAMVSVHDRGFLYGDGLFETVRAAEGRLLLWDEHRRRLGEGLDRLQLSLPPGLSRETLHPTALELLRRNRLLHAVVRFAVTRGCGPRGYSPRQAGPGTLVIATHPGIPLDAPPPPPRRLATARVRLAVGDPLTSLKSSSRLLNVAARAEAEESGADEALLLNDAGRVAEAGSANIFWWESHGLHTPPLAEGPLAGVTRAVVLGLARTLGIPTEETAAPPSRLVEASGVFLTQATQGLVEVDTLDGHPLRRDPRTAALRGAYLDLLRAEP